MALPFLPGNVFDKNLGKIKFHKSHHLNVLEGQNLRVGEEKPGIGGERLPSQRQDAPHSYIPRGHGPGVPDLPSWVAFDKQVLSFDAYFQQDVPESRLEQYAIRRVRVLFYLEDDSVQIVEPRIANSGLAQGTLVRRHRVPRPAPDDERFYTVEDLNIGQELNIYSVVYRLVDCDQFTRNFLTKLGFRVGPSIQFPADPYSDNRKSEAESKTPYRSYQSVDTRGQFLDHDRHVLRFYGYWDDRDEMFGDEHWLVVHYYLADDTVELIERLPPNCGRDAAPWFVHRARLPKIVEPMRMPGQDAPRTLLNVLGAANRQVHGQRWILDPLKIGDVKQEFYSDSDLTIGAVINAWGRRVVVYDCDCFTKEYYRSKYGITDFTPISIPGGARMPSSSGTQDEDHHPDPHKPVIPPYNGYGSEEDSLGYCLSLEPKAPIKDFIKFMAYDRRGYDSNVLRFAVKFENPDPLDCDRRLILSYYRTDDTISIFEPPTRNSGRVAGKFLERSRVKKPGQERYRVEFSEYYTGEDLFVGARININNHKFVLIDADDYVFNYMEKHKNEFEQSDVNNVMARLRAIVQCRGENEVRSAYCPSHDSAPIPYDQFVEILCSLAEGRLTEHDVVTLARRYSADGEDDSELEWVLVQIQARLKRFGFDEFSALRDQALHHDYTRNGKLNKRALWSTFKALRVPLTNDMLDTLLERTIVVEKRKSKADRSGNDCCQTPCQQQQEQQQEREGENLIEYSNLVDSIDWRCNPLDYGGSVPELFDPTWQGQQGETKDVKVVKVVNYRKMMEDLIGCPPAPPPPEPLQCCKT